MDHRTGKPLAKIPDYVTNKKKKKTAINDTNAKDIKAELEAGSSVQSSEEKNVIQILDDDLELPSTSGLTRGFQFSDDADYTANNYDMSIMLDIDEFSDFQLLSPKEDFEGQDDISNAEQFSIIDATGKIAFNKKENNILIYSLIRSSVLQ